MSRYLTDERIRAFRFDETILYRHFKARKVKTQADVAEEARRILDIAFMGVEEESPIDALINVVAVSSHNIAVKKLAHVLGVNYDAMQETLYDMYEGGPKMGRERFFARVAEMESAMRSEATPTEFSEPDSD